MRSEEDEKRNFCRSSKPDSGAHAGREMARETHEPPSNQRAASGGEADTRLAGIENAGFEDSERSVPAELPKCEARQQRPGDIGRDGEDNERTSKQQSRHVLEPAASSAYSEELSPPCLHPRRGNAVRISTPSRHAFGARRGPSAHNRRLWFERNWAAALGESAGVDGLSASSETRNIGKPGFPDVQLGQDRGCLERPIAESASDESSDSIVFVKPRVYSIGVFYSDTDQCRPEDDGRRVGAEVSPTKAMARGRPSAGDGAPLSEPRRSCRSRRSANDRRTAPQTPDSFPETPGQPDGGSGGNSALPDILNSHLPPPYSTLPPGGRRLPPPSHPPPPPPPPLCGTGVPPGTTVLPGPCPHSTPRRSSRGRAPFRGFPPRDRLRSSGRRGPSFGAPAASESDEPKHCCGVMVTQTVSIRWFIVMIAFVGLCCAIVGTVLGALKANGKEHLTVSLLMIGVGIVLITVSGIAWRLTSHDAPSCRAMLGLQNTEQEPNRRFVPRVPPYGRPHHPYAAMMYPEFQYRPPPPSYQASMQEYRLRLLLLDRQQGSSGPSVAPAPAGHSALSPVSPPPTYRSYTGSILHSRPPLTLTERDYSRPPSYRSRASSAGVLRPSTETLASSRDTLTGPGGAATSHSRDPSLSLSFLSHESLFVDSSHSRMPDSSGTVTDNPVHFTSPSGESQNSVLAGLSDDSPEQPHSLERGGSWRRDGRSVWALRKLHDVNAVTIVQTTDSSQVLNQDTVILSIPGHCPRVESSPGEVQILAHV